MQKKQILIFPFDLMSHYLRCITLAAKYSDYEVLFAYSQKYDALVKKAGFNSFYVEQFNSSEVMDKAAKFDFSWLNYLDLERVYLSQVKVIEELKPYLVISDTSPTLKMASEKTNVKCVALMNAYMSKHYKGVRGVSRTHYSYEYLKKLPQSIAIFITKIAEKAAFKKVHEPFKRLRKTYGLGKKKFYLDELEGDENLICDSPDIFSIKNAPYNYKVIGPLLYKQSNNENELITSLNNSKKNICVCLGSSGNWSALKFLSNNKYRAVNWIIAGDVKNEIKGAHIFSKDFINLDKILPLCDLLICHGGNGTIYEGLKHAKYMLFLTNHFEQEWNAQRLSELGNGIQINDNPEKIINEKLTEILIQK